MIKGCHENRGPSSCVNRKCMCPDGFCAKDNGAGYGVCELADSTEYTAEVAAVNQKQRKFPAPHSDVSSGLAFSGGGARALSNTLGAYRALEQLGLMPYLNAISCVSGGCWASSIYMFADLKTDDLLGKPTEPAKLTLSQLEKQPAALGASVTTSDKSFLTRVLLSHLDPHSIWQSFIGETILRPFGLDNPEAFMAASVEEVNRIKKHNPHLKDATFQVPRSDRPKVFVINGALLSPEGFSGGNNVSVSFQMSPDFTGSPFWPQDGPLNFQPSKNGALYPLRDQFMGGGFVETFAFGGGDPKYQSASGLQKVKAPRLPFTLTNAVGISSLAPGAMMATEGKYQFGVPKSNYWPVLPSKSQKQPARAFGFGDGGTMDNSGILALLQRGATKVAMWASTYIPLASKRYPKLDFCKLQGTTWDELLGDADDLVVAPMVSDKFGYPYSSPGSYYTHNQVFAKEELPSLLCQMQQLKQAGKPVVLRSRHRVLPNSWWGIEGGNSVDLLIVYLEQSSDFEKQLPEETRKSLGPKKAENRTWASSGDLARFPHYKTTGQTEQHLEITRLTNREVNLLAGQSEYAVLQNAALFRDVLCPSGSAGICCRNPGTSACKD